VTETLTMGQRRAGQAAIEELLRHHRQTRTRSLVARVFGRSPLSTEATALHRDALAQIAVGGVLDRLPAEWTVISAVPGSDEAPGIDHVVVGPAGLFTISCRVHTNRVVWVADSILVVDRTTLGHIPEAVKQAQRVTDLLGERMLLPATAQPVVAIVDAKRITIRERPADVLVLDARGLNATLTGLPAVLGAAELQEIRGILNDPQSWNDGTPELPDGDTNPDARARLDALLEEFAALDSEILIAEARRVGWKLAAYAVVLIAPIAAFPYLVDLVAAITTR
jgi:hypothetical protein